MADRRPGRSALALVAALVTAVAGPGGGGPGAAGAQTSGREPSLALASKTAWWTPGQPFDLGLRIGAVDPASLVAVASVHRAVRSRIEFNLSSEGRLNGRPVGASPAVPVPDLAAGPDGAQVLSFVPDVSGPGVYPVRVELLPAAGGSAVASLVTHLVHAPGPVEEEVPLAVAAVLPVHARPAVQPDGRVAIDDERAEQLSALARSLVARPEVALTLAATPETVEALAASPRAQDRATLEALAGAPPRQLLGAHYVPTDLTALLDAGLAQESAAQLAVGIDTLRAALGEAPGRGVRMVDGYLSDQALRHLGDQGADRLVVPEGLLEPVDRNVTLAETFVLGSGGGPVRAAMADAGLAAHFAREGGPALAAHTLLADLAVLYFDSPAAPRGVVVAPPRSWAPSARFVDVLLEGLATGPVLDDVTVDRFFETVPDAPGPAGRGADPVLVRRLAPGPTRRPAALPGPEIRTARSRLEAFASALEPANPVLDRMERLLLASESSDLRPRDRARYLQGSREQLMTEIEGVSMPRHRAITLTAREGDIPVTVTSRLGYPLRAVLRLESDGLEFPAGSSVELAIGPRNTTQPIPVRARASGSFPVQLRLEAPAGDLVLASSRFTVRSTAVGGVARALSIGAALFLLVWWATHLRAKRSRKLVPA